MAGKDKSFRKKVAFDLSEDVFERLHEHCKAYGRTLLLGSLPVLENDQVFNATVLVGPEQKAQIVYNKIHLFDVDVEGEKSLRESDQYDRGLNPKVIEVGGWKLGLSICYDLRFPELYMEYLKESVDAILVPAAFLVPTGKAHWQVLLRARAIENQCYVVAAAQAGVHKNAEGKTRETYGHSLVVSPWGKILAEAESAGPEILELELDPQAIVKMREQIPMKQHRGQRLWATTES